MSLTFHLTTEIPASAESIYNAWLNSQEHALMTNSESAVASHEVGAAYKAHGEHIWGKNIELVPNKKIVQTWRTKGFKETDPDSLLEVQFEDNGATTKLTLTHSEVPDQEVHAESGWTEHYFKPMTKYFQSRF